MGRFGAAYVRCCVYAGLWTYLKSWARSFFFLGF